MADLLALRRYRVNLNPSNSRKINRHKQHIDAEPDDSLNAEPDKTLDFQ